ncbi:MAG: hypothetical protein MZV70_75100, partial [Desulfobacterales bacterium]|nr:hypothetical protein [Desulfobacterales bacterium]
LRIAKVNLVTGNTRPGAPIDPAEDEDDGKTQHDVGRDLDGKKYLGIDVGHEHATLSIVDFRLAVARDLQAGVQ